MVQLPIFNGFLSYKGHVDFSAAFFLAKMLEKVSFNPHNIIGDFGEKFQR